MGIRFLSMAAGAALALAACGGSQERGQVPVDSPLTQFEGSEAAPGDDDDWFADEAFEELDDDLEGDRAGEDEAAPGASNSSASEDAQSEGA
jgi:hypothetical protein